VLIFDEVMTGFRVAQGGAQALYGVTPDLTTLGKIIGGGLPVGAFGGRADIMSHVAPEGGVYQAGTLSGNPLAMAAGLTMLDALDDSVYATLATTTEKLWQGLQAARHGVTVTVNRVCGMFSLFFTGSRSPSSTMWPTPTSPPSIGSFTPCWTKGVYLAPSAFEAAFVSTAHDDEAVHATLDAADRAFAALAGNLTSGD
jgi:glutamate-1-semialdehyde 2,1-aminomutase